MVDRIDVEFSAIDGTKLAARLFRPANRFQSFPAVTMAHGNKRSSRIPRHFWSPDFTRTRDHKEFFNSHA